jgi:hypothetical protein
MAKIFEIASQVSTPLALAGFFAAVVFFIFRQIVAKNVFPRFTAAVGARMLRLIIDRLFVLALVAMCLGFCAYLVPLAFGAGRATSVATPPAASTAPAADVEAASAVARSQLDARDYVGAWNTVVDALKSAPTRADLLELQTDVAMRWIRDVSVPEGQKFGDVVDKLLPALHQCVQRNKATDKRRAADALAHVGWADFLKRRDGDDQIDVEGPYREAVRLDPDNPFAHAMWGHWLIANGRHLDDAKTHFAAALKSGREKAFVREWQFAALEWNSSVDDDFELIRVCNDMRKGGEPPPGEERRVRVLGRLYFAQNRAMLENIDTVLPPDEHLATIRWLRKGLESEASPSTDFFVARLLEATRDHDAALRAYVALLDVGFVRADDVRNGIARCEKASPGAKTAADLLRDRLKDADAGVRRDAVRGLDALYADGDVAAALAALVPALQDTDERVRAAAGDAIGRIAGKLASRKDRGSLDVLRAALKAEQEANLDPETIAPLREAVDALAK